jgi:hypothetical protein
MKVLIRTPARLHFETSSSVWLTTSGIEAEGVFVDASVFEG